MRIDQRHPDKPDHLILSCRGSTGVLEIGDVGTSLTVITAPEGTNMDVFQFVCASAENLPRKGQGWKDELKVSAINAQKILTLV